MVNLKSTNCPACGASVQVSQDAERVTCDYCGTHLVVDRNEGELDLTVAQNLSETFEQVARQTQDTIQKGTEVTQAELRRLQIGQQLASLQLKLSTIRSEIRSFERGGRLSTQSKRQLHDLRVEEQECLDQIRSLNALLTGDRVSTEHSAPVAPSPEPNLRSRFLRGCGWGCLAFIVAGVSLGFLAIPLDAVLFDISFESEALGPFFSLASCAGFLAGVIVFLRFLVPNAGIWRRLPFAKTDD